MKRFKQIYLEESVQSKEVSALNSYIKRSLKGVKFTSSSRGGYHTRFALNMTPKQYKIYFAKAGLEVQAYNGPSVSSKFDTLLLVTTKDLPRIPKGTSIPWVNNYIGAAKSGPQLFNNKDLSPDSLGLAGQEYDKKSLMDTVESILKTKYDEEVANELISMVNLANTKTRSATFDTTFGSKDLAKVSADYGEVLAAIWAMANLGFKAAFFPLASNEKLIDFYGVRVGVRYPISVKSGGGGKVTVQNIIDAINSRAKTANNLDLDDEAAINIFKIVNDLPMREQMIELHKYMKTDKIEKLSEIMGISVDMITLDLVKQYVENKDREELVEELAPFWGTMKLTDKVKFGSDALRLVVSPLGESIWKILNGDAAVKKSLTNVARQVTLIQVNVNVLKKRVTFESNFFRDAEFEFGWAGYAAGNKLGFKMKLVK
tara:strand:- start:19678 stop:20967 length:1290 start_codon:yes stop_codon:yes gene_type:complete